MAGAALPLAAAAGIGMGGGVLGGGIALGGSFAVGDAAAQGLGLAVGMQDHYSISQTVFAGGTGFVLGGYTGYRNPGLASFSSGFRSLLPGKEKAPIGAALQRPSVPRGSVKDVGKYSLSEDYHQIVVGRNSKGTFIHRNVKMTRADHEIWARMRSERISELHKNANTQEYNAQSMLRWYLKWKEVFCKTRNTQEASDAANKEHL